MAAAGLTHARAQCDGAIYAARAKHAQHCKVMLSARVCASPLARAGAVSRPRRCSLRSVAARVAAPEAPVEAYIVSDDEESDSDWEEYSSDEDEVLNPPLSTYVPTNDLVKTEIEEVEDFEEPEEEWNQDYEDVMAEAFCFGKPDDMWGFGGKEEGEEDDMEWGEEEKKILFATWNQWYKDGREIVSDEVKDVCNWPLDMRPLSEQYAEIDELVENEPDLPQLGDLVTVEVTSVSEEGATVWSEDFAATLDVAVNDLTALSIEHVRPSGLATPVTLLMSLERGTCIAVYIIAIAASAHAEHCNVQCTDV